LVHLALMESAHFHLVTPMASMGLASTQVWKVPVWPVRHHR